MFVAVQGEGHLVLVFHEAARLPEHIDVDVTFREADQGRPGGGEAGIGSVVELPVEPPEHSVRSEVDIRPAQG